MASPDAISGAVGAPPENGTIPTGGLDSDDPSRPWRLYHRNSFEFMRSMPDDAVDVAIMDPPYSERQHKGVRSSKRNRLADGNGRKDTKAATGRMVDLGFPHFTRNDCQLMAYELARLVRRWSLIFCDDDLLPVWRAVAKRAGLQVIRTGIWVRVGGAPQFTGDRPGAGAEYIVILHRPSKRGVAPRWNGGGMPAVYVHPIVANRSGHRHDRIFSTQKPESLMLQLVDLYSEPCELVFDPTSGSGTTGVAAIRQGRRFLGIEQVPETYVKCRDRLAAEVRGLDLHSARSGQLSILDYIGSAG